MDWLRAYKEMTAHERRRYMSCAIRRIGSGARKAVLACFAAIAAFIALLVLLTILGLCCAFTVYIAESLGPRILKTI